MNKNVTSNVTVVQMKKYGCFRRIFCCKCIHCCQSFDFSLLTSEHRKDVFHQMIKKYVKSIENETDIIIDPFFILLGLLLGDGNSQVNSSILLQIDNSQNNQAVFSKQDLQFYIPQLCTYLVFHEQMTNVPIFNLMERTCKIDLQFSLRYYFYMKSLERINENTEFKIVMKYNSTFRKKINHLYRTSEKEKEYQKLQIQTQQMKTIKSYNNRPLKNASFHFQKVQQLKFTTPYKPIFSQYQIQSQQGIFESTLNFISDLVHIGKQLLKSTNRKEDLHQMLKEMNSHLPSTIYVPLLKNSYRNMKVAGIIFEESKVFCTKSRCPYYVCLQAYEEVVENPQKSEKKIRSTKSLDSRSLRRTRFFEQDNIESDFCSDSQNEAQVEKTIHESSKKKKGVWNKLFKFMKKTNEIGKQDLNQEQQTQSSQTFENDETLFLFGQNKMQQEERIKKISPFGQLPKYRLVHLMIKTFDDLRQQSFAMQLLEEFNRIFAMENLDIRVIPYEVLPLDKDSGIIQFIKDALTIDELRKRQGNLNFIKNESAKIKNFMKTLVGYSLVTYLLQVKDRHNGNIMIKKDGSILHIDYGFFLSNAPGKGVQLQKNVAFKLTNEYVQVLGGVQSKTFAQFRKLFYQGYYACHKHQHRILILSKLMYSSHGTTMPCFQKGNESIQHLQERFNPVGIRTDGDMSLFCQNLINKSIDNWRARWYDKWQYYMQGILY